MIFLFFNLTDTYLDFTRRIYRLKTHERAAAINNQLTVYLDIPLINMIIRPLFIAFLFGIIGAVAIFTRTLKHVLLPEGIPGWYYPIS